MIAGAVGLPRGSVTETERMLAHNVAALLKSSLGTARTVEVDETPPELGPDLPLRGPIRGRVQLMRIQTGILARCQIEGTTVLECGRCLESFPWPFSVSFEEEFRPTVSIATGAPLPAVDDEALRIDDRHILDLREITRQYVTTALPLRPICRDACAGLCPTCGANLNLEACACPPAAPEGPLASLAGLLRQEDA